MREQFLTSSDAAQVLGLSSEGVRDLERRGKLPAQKTRKGYRIFKQSDVERLRLEREEQKETTEQ